MNGNRGQDRQDPHNCLIDSWSLRNEESVIIWRIGAFESSLSLHNNTFNNSVLCITELLTNETQIMSAYFPQMNCVYRLTARWLEETQSADGVSLNFVLPKLQNTTDMYDEPIWLLKSKYNWILSLLLLLHFHHQSPSLSVSHSLTFSISLWPPSSVIFLLFFHSLQFRLVPSFIFPPSLYISDALFHCRFQVCLFYFLPFEFLFHSLLLFSHTLPFVLSIFFWNNNHPSRAAGVHTVEYSGYAILPPLCENTECYAVAPWSHQCREK